MSWLNNRSSLFVLLFLGTSLAFFSRAIAIPAPIEKEAKPRDPFESPLTIETQVTPVPSSPLLQFALSQFKLSGIIWGSLGRSAVVESPDGKCYVLKEGDAIGRLGGKVQVINQENMVVKNNYQDYEGKICQEEVIIKLYKQEKQPE